MTVVPMLRFGRTLTDREYGKSIASTILTENSFPIALDFKGVITLGSSCGDEILNAIGPKQNGSVRIMNANSAVRACLEKVSEDIRVRIVGDPS